MASDEGTPDSLFGSSNTPNPDAPSPVPSSSVASAAAPAFVPRALKRKTVRPRPSSSTGFIKPSPVLEPSTVAVSLSAPSPTASSSNKPPEARKHSQQERDRLESILCTVETALSDYGLAAHRGAGGPSGAGGLLERFKEGKEWLHISLILTLPPVRALTGSLHDLQQALRLRDSPVVKMDATGFQVGRKEHPDVQRLEKLDAADWDDAVVYIARLSFLFSESIPFSLGAGDSSITTFLGSALSTVPQRVIHPPLFDRSNPLALDPLEASGSGGEASQADAFRAAQDAQRGTRRARPLPKSGGPFKGFAFVVLPDKQEADRVLAQWPWDRHAAAVERDGTMPEELEREEQNAGDGEDADMSAARGVEVATAEEEDDEDKEDQPHEQGKAERPSCADRAHHVGMRALSYDAWLQLKDEYLAYRHAIEALLEAQQDGSLAELRNPPAQRDQPPHLAKPTSQRDPPSSTSKRVSKRAASPVSPEFNGDHLPLHSGGAGPPQPQPPQNKRVKRASSPTSVLNSRLKRIRTPSPGLDLTSEAALEVAGAFPAACVLWVRNVHEKSTRTSLKALFGALLETLQEGSGKGVEFVDYEKGLDTCYLRFSSPALASLILEYLSTTPSLHLSLTALSPVGALSPSSRTAAEADLRRPLAATLLEGDAERKYWANVPEATRKAARHAAGATVALLKTSSMGSGDSGAGGGLGGGGGGGGGGRRGGRGRRRHDANGGTTAAVVEVSEPHAKEEVGEEERAAPAALAEEPVKKRKKPSRLGN